MIDEYLEGRDAGTGDGPDEYTCAICHGGDPRIDLSSATYLGGALVHEACVGDRALCRSSREDRRAARARDLADHDEPAAGHERGERRPSESAARGARGAGTLPSRGMASPVLREAVVTTRAEYLAKLRGRPSVVERVLAAITSGAETHVEICDRTGLFWPRVGLILTKLKNDGKIRKEGKTTGARWFVEENPPSVTSVGEIERCSP